MQRLISIANKVFHVQKHGRMETGPNFFNVTTSRGFGPVSDPVTDIPLDYKVVNEILNNMPVIMKDGHSGLLAHGTLGHAVDNYLPQYTIYRQDFPNNPGLAEALFRDYTFLASAYLLEPCYHTFLESVKEEKMPVYGIGRSVLPSQIAIPLEQLATFLKTKPFMEYSQSYAINNWTRKNYNRRLDFDNLEMFRTFEGSISERGFTMLHMSMVSQTGPLVREVANVLDGVWKDDREMVNNSLYYISTIMRGIQDEFATMWSRSDPNAYNSFRTFIFGIKNQSMFPDGVIYEGTTDESPRFYRGESGANDSIIPTLDTLLQLDFEVNELTDALKDFRTYRPSTHNQYITLLGRTTSILGVRDYCMKQSTTILYYLLVLDSVSQFREHHWSLVKNYIINRSKHPTATGGTPIVKWLPNQLRTVLENMDAIIPKINIDELSNDEKKLYKNICNSQENRLAILNREVKKLSQSC